MCVCNYTSFPWSTRAACHANSRTQRLGRKSKNQRRYEAAGTARDHSGAGLLVFNAISSYYWQCDLKWVIYLLCGYLIRQLWGLNELIFVRTCGSRKLDMLVLPSQPQGCCMNITYLVSLGKVNSSGIISLIKQQHKGCDILIENPLILTI